MATSAGKTIVLILLIFIIILAAWRITPLIFTPFGAVSSVFHEVDSTISHNFRGFPFNAFSWGFRGIVPLMLFLLWILVIVWVYRDAERRGMNGILWALLVFIGNLIGLLIYLIVRSDNAPAGSGRSDRFVSSCCRKPIQPQHKFCPQCGESLNDICGGCGKPVQPDWKICPSCGHKIKDD